MTALAPDARLIREGRRSPEGQESQFVCVEDYERFASAVLSPAVSDWIDGGSGAEVTLKENRAAFGRLSLWPRVLVDVSHCDLSTTVLGSRVDLPVLIAPVGHQGLVHPEGECATARAAEAAGTVMTVPVMASCSLEEVAASTTAPLWFQLYVFRDRALTGRLVSRAERAGYRALVVTVDAPRLGRRERDLRSGFALPPGLGVPNLSAEMADGLWTGEPGVSAMTAHADAAFDPSVTWQFLERLCSTTSMPVVVKGILTPADADLACRAGAAGIVVSNHGGRQLDGAPASIDALERVVRAVAGRCEVYVDGGIRRGEDVLKALALGARAVFVGRPAFWGLATGGSDGVRHVLELLRTQLDRAMALAGRPRLADIDPSLVGR